MVTITESAIRGLGTEASFARGEEYYYNEAVSELVKRGHLLTAEVQGSDYEPYRVTIELTDDRILSTDCTCPYDWGGACKHIIAVLLAYLRRPEQVSQRPPVGELLTGLGEGELRDVLIDLLEAEPHLIDRVEAQLQLRRAPQPAAPAGQHTGIMEEQPQEITRAPVDTAPYRRQAKQLMRVPDRWDYYASSGIASQFSGLLAEVQPFLQAGDGSNALRVLEAIVEPYLDSWYDFDDSDGELGAVFSEIGPLFAEAVLSVPLSPQERRAWAEKFTTWQGEIDDYGIDEGFDVAIAAAGQGWDYPPLQAVLQGHITEKGTWEHEEPPWYADDLALARLNVLERQGRTTEYLYLAEAEGQIARYLTMLVKLGRSQEALGYARQYTLAPDETLALAQALRDHGQPEKAADVAASGLTLPGQSYHLARWLRDFAPEVGRPDIALNAARTVFAHSMSLENYEAVRAAAGSAWESVKLELLQQLGAARYGGEKIDIYLHEGMVDEAVAAVKADAYVGFDTLRRVVEAAGPSYPDWAIQQCRRQAEQIMDAGKSQQYHYALDWLDKARRVYLEAGREQEWRSYLEQLIQRHARKYSLRPGLEALRR